MPFSPEPLVQTQNNFTEMDLMLPSTINDQKVQLSQGSHRLEKYLNLEGFLEKSLKIKSALKSTGKSLKSLEKSLNSTIF